MTQGARLNALMAQYDQGHQYAVVECAHPQGCTADARVDGSYSKTDAELTKDFEALGWTVSPTRCPEHTQTADQQE